MKKIIFLYIISYFLITAFVPLYSVFADLIVIGPPSDATIYSNGINPGGVLKITGRNLPNNIKLTGNCANVITLAGQTDANNTNILVNIPNTVALGSYNVTVFGFNGSFDLSDKLNVVEKRGVSPTFPRSIVPSLLGTTNLGELIGNIFNFSIQILGLIIFVIIVISGFQWLMAGGNPGAISKAQSRITQALLGAVILLSSFLILKTINPDLIKGGFQLEGINVPKGEVIITERGPCGEIVALPAGGGSAALAEKAKELISAIGIGRFSTDADCGGNFNARQNIQDIADAKLPAVCSPTCSASNPCISGGSSGTISINPAIIDGLNNMTKRNLPFTVTSFTTGKHDVNSKHYSGNSVDIVPLDRSPSVWIEARTAFNSYGGTAICESKNGQVVQDCNPAIADHIHWQK